MSVCRQIFLSYFNYCMLFRNRNDQHTVQVTLAFDLIHTYTTHQCTTSQNDFIPPSLFLSPQSIGQSHFKVISRFFSSFDKKKHHTSCIRGNIYLISQVLQVLVSHKGREICFRAVLLLCECSFPWLLRRANLMPYCQVGKSLSSVSLLL